MAFCMENWKYASNNTSGNKHTPSMATINNNVPRNCKFFLGLKNTLLTIV